MSTVSGAPVRMSGPTAGADELRAMLLSVEDVRRIIDMPDLEINETYDDVPDDDEFSAGVCAGVPFNTSEVAYRDREYQAVQGTNMRSPGEFPEHWVDQALVRFNSGDDAQRFVADAVRIWRDCAGAVINTVPEDSVPQRWTIGDTKGSALPMVTSSLVGIAGYTCAHAMTDKTNLVIDVVVCSRGVNDEAETILHRIASRVLPV